MADVLAETQYGMNLRAELQRHLRQILRMNNLVDGKVDVSNLTICQNWTPHSYEKFVLHPNDILFNRTNSYDLVGKYGNL